MMRSARLMELTQKADLFKLKKSDHGTKILLV